jgi:hypothetical protein
MDCDCVFGFIEQYTMITDSEPKESLKLIVEWFNPARASLGVAMDGFEDVQCSFLFNRTDLFRDVGPKADLLHATA